MVNLNFINEQMSDESVLLMYDSDLAAYKANVKQNFKFPLLANLTLLQQLKTKSNTSFEIMFSTNGRGQTGVFLYEETQRLYSNQDKTIRINESFIFDILYNNNCDEAVLYFDGNTYSFIYQVDCNSSLTNKLLRCVTSLPAKIFYVIVIAYKAVDFLQDISSLGQVMSWQW